MDKKWESFKCLGMSPRLFVCLVIVIIIICSVLGYLLGLNHISDADGQEVKVNIKTDSAMMEMIRSRTKVEMEMLRIIGERPNAPTVNNFIRQPQCQPQIQNSFNNNHIRLDSVGK